MKQDHWGGIDRGALILINHSINPVFSVGDFDSVSEEERLQLLCSDRHLPSDVLATLKQDHWGGIDRGALILINHSINPVFQLEISIQFQRKNVFR